MIHTLYKDVFPHAFSDWSFVQGEKYEYYKKYLKLAAEKNRWTILREQRKVFYETMVITKSYSIHWLSPGK